MWISNLKLLFPNFLYLPTDPTQSYPTSAPMPHFSNGNRKKLVYLGSCSRDGRTAVRENSWVLVMGGKGSAVRVNALLLESR